LALSLGGSRLVAVGQGRSNVAALLYFTAVLHCHLIQSDEAVRQRLDLYENYRRGQGRPQARFY